ncbi:MAG: membrane protein insertion efficiency factor YidD [Gammaproteobacteria bacterium]|jgi:hypothetical protein|nr:membrane protein insertion efficiency factor YidD [Gammaproteobacteria bacterium]
MRMDRALFLWVMGVMTPLAPLQAAENPLALSQIEQHEIVHQHEDEREQSATKRLLLAPLRFYATVLSRIDGDRCPSYPNCSLYSRQAIHKHGALTGWWMTVDRLIHERTEIEQASRIQLSDGRPRVYDPLEINDFWVREKER